MKRCWAEHPSQRPRLEHVEQYLAELLSSLERAVEQEELEEELERGRLRAVAEEKKDAASKGREKEEEENWKKANIGGGGQAADGHGGCYSDDDGGGGFGSDGEEEENPYAAGSVLGAFAAPFASHSPHFTVVSNAPSSASPRVPTTAAAAEASSLLAASSPPPHSFPWRSSSQPSNPAGRRGAASTATTLLGMPIHEHNHNGAAAAAAAAAAGFERWGGFTGFALGCGVDEGAGAGVAALLDPLSLPDPLDLLQDSLSVSSALPWPPSQYGQDVAEGERDKEDELETLTTESGDDIYSEETPYGPMGF
mmetsp:Transcript_71175/g.122320  ORF Transcript_71175/g.122320 Transcript_71175/m.122320 type:complete len:309 (-) Transcript_71175:282-1208(-)